MSLFLRVKSELNDKSKRNLKLGGRMLLFNGMEYRYFHREFTNIRVNIRVISDEPKVCCRHVVIVHCWNVYINTCGIR